MSASGIHVPSGPAIPPGAGPGPDAPVARPGRRWPRRLAWSALAVVVVLAAAFFGAGGWYFAGQIESGALAVKPASPLPTDNDVRVVGVSGGQVRLRAIGDQPALAKPMLFGIAWPGGFGQLGTAVTVSGSVVTRPLTVTSGSAPRPGQAAALSNAYYLGDPGQALGIPVRDVVVHGPLGALPAWYFPGRGDTFVVAVHGQNGARKDVLRLTGIAHQQGFPVLAITYRNDLGVARDPSGYLQYGQTEWRDLQAAVQWCMAHGARHIVLAGQSMGAAIVASFLQHSALVPRVTRVVFDAPMLDLGAAVDYGASQRSLPLVGAVPGPLVWTAKQIASARFGVDWAATDYLTSTSWLTVPALVTQGSADKTVPVSVPATLKQLRPSLVTLAVFPGAGHLESWNINRARYTSLLTSFLAPVAP
jgi:alpha-beta hydrolase superfamily lysophospholipase